MIYNLNLMIIQQTIKILVNYKNKILLNVINKFFIDYILGKLIIRCNYT